MTNPRTQRKGAGVESVTHHGTRPEQDTQRTDLPRQLRRRRAASWRCEPLASGHRDPWTDQHPDDWSDAEITGWIAAAEHLRAHGLYGRWQVPDSARQAWRRRSCPCRRGDAA